jgi:hypothetical protein
MSARPRVLPVGLRQRMISRSAGSDSCTSVRFRIFRKNSSPSRVGDQPSPCQRSLLFLYGLSMALRSTKVSGIASIAPAEEEAPNHNREHDLEKLLGVVVMSKIVTSGGTPQFESLPATATDESGEGAAVVRSNAKPIRGNTLSDAGQNVILVPLLKGCLD